jgi:LysM repeat protein
MKILKILGIAAAVHALALLLIFANPGCSYTKAASTDSSPISAAPPSDAPTSTQSAPAPASQDIVGIRYSPTRPNTTVAAALESEPVSDVTPATTYTVVKGDTLSSVAKKNKLTKAELAAANNLRSTSVLHQGQKLVIPAKSQAPAAAASEEAPAEKPTAASSEATKHVVKPGETLGGIARKYGVRQGDIAVANNITDPRKIQPGQELVIPARSSSKQAKSAKPAAEAPKPAPAAQDQDLDAGLKPPSTTDVPAVKIDEAPVGSQSGKP